MTFTTKQNKIIEIMIALIKISVMNLKSFIGNKTLLTGVVISLANFLAKKVIKTTSIMSIFVRLAVFIARTRFSPLSKRQFSSHFFGAHSFFLSNSHSFPIAYFRTIFASASRNPRRNSLQKLTANFTGLFKRIYFISIPIMRSAGKRTESFVFKFRTILKEFATPITFLGNKLRKSSSLEITRWRTIFRVLSARARSIFLVANNAFIHWYRNYTIALTQSQEGRVI